MKDIILLGSTGSIGTQTLEIIADLPERFGVSVLACGSNIPLLRQQIEAFSPRTVVVADPEDAARLRAEYPSLEVLVGDAGLAEAAAGEGDLVVNALVGIRGLIPTMAALEAGKDIALANKETLVTGGSLVMDEAKEMGAKILPIDSEHSAVFQCLQGAGDNPMRKLILTASGGPFRGRKREDLIGVTVEDTLAHPNWDMGAKITVDSATLMNKGFEVIEAVHLFGIAPEQVQVTVHPQSVMHSAVEFADGAVIAQLGTPDMRLPISYALCYPDRIDHGYEGLDLFSARELTFEEPDRETFPCLDLAFDALATGGVAPAALNGANEVLVAAFLQKKIDYLTIPDTLVEVMRTFPDGPADSLEDILAADLSVRARTMELIK